MANADAFVAADGGTFGGSLSRSDTAGIVDFHPPTRILALRTADKGIPASTYVYANKRLILWTRGQLLALVLHRLSVGQQRCLSGYAPEIEW